MQSAHMSSLFGRLFRPRSEVLIGFGDSITWGSGNTDGPAHAYLACAAQIIGIDAVNLSWPGALADNALHHIPRVTAQSPIVAVNIGTNNVGVASANVTAVEAADAIRATLGDADAVLELCRRQFPYGRIVVVTVRDLGRAGAAYPNVTAAALTAATAVWNERLRALAARLRCRVLDLEYADEWYQRDEYDATGIHPNDAGARRLGRALAVHAA
jgi:lysophospholipase L1-like esterase